MVTDENGKNVVKVNNLQIHRLLGSIDDPVRKMKWQQIQGEVNSASRIKSGKIINTHHWQVAQEYDVVKNIMQTLNMFKVR